MDATAGHEPKAPAPPPAAPIVELTPREKDDEALIALRQSAENAIQSQSANPRDGSYIADALNRIAIALTYILETFRQ